MKPETLKTLLPLRKQREEAALGALNAAQATLLTADKMLKERQRQRDDLNTRIEGNVTLLQQSLGTGQAVIQDINRHRHRLDWLKDALSRADDTVREALETVTAAQLHAQELKRAYLRLRAKTEVVQTQLARAQQQTRTMEAHRTATAIEELGIHLHR